MVKPKTFDVIRVKNLTRVMVQNQLVLMLKEPVDVVCSALDEAIGTPKDIAANLKANGCVNFNVEAEIPQITVA